MKFLNNIITKKRGSEASYRELVVIIATIVVFSMIMFFLYKYSSGAFLFQEAYAKEVALALDAAEPGMKIKFDFEEAYESAKKNDYGEKEEEKLLEINETASYVKVKLDKSGGYKYKFFSNHSYEKKENKEDKIITVYVKE